jgi:hypothetical protein
VAGWPQPPAAARLKMTPCRAARSGRWADGGRQQLLLSLRGWFKLGRLPQRGGIDCTWEPEPDSESEPPARAPYIQRQAPAQRYILTFDLLLRSSRYQANTKIEHKYLPESPIDTHTTFLACLPESCAGPYQVHLTDLPTEMATTALHAYRHRFIQQEGSSWMKPVQHVVVRL